LSTTTSTTLSTTTTTTTTLSTTSTPTHNTTKKRMCHSRVTASQKLQKEVSHFSTENKYITETGATAAPNFWRVKGKDDEAQHSLRESGCNLLSSSASSGQSENCENNSTNTQ
ncbi:hypothetical protein FHG87_022247, partial [Trinorchestia longiramus]